MTGRPGGRFPLVMLCRGEHCGRRLAAAAHDEPDDRLRAAVRATPGGLLVMTGCMHRCGGHGGSRPAATAIAAVAWRDAPDATAAGDLLVFAGVDEPATARTLAEWISAEPADTDEALGSLPLSLRASLIA